MGFVFIYCIAKERLRSETVTARRGTIQSFCSRNTAVMKKGTHKMQTNSLSRPISEGIRIEAYVSLNCYKLSDR